MDKFTQAAGHHSRGKDMIEVSEDQFYKAIGPENVHPTPHPYHSEWRSLSTHAVVGRSEPGYKSPYGTPRRYWLEEQFSARKPVN